MSTPELRHLWVKYWRRHRELNERYNQEMEAWCQIPFHIRKHTRKPKPPTSTFPEELRGLICGAKTRKGTPCKQRNLYDSGRCLLHGGLSTGPRTKRGKRRSALNGFKAST